MDGYILDLRNKFQHMQPKKPQFSPHKHLPIEYGATQQLLQPIETNKPLNEKGIKRIQGIVGALLYVGRAVNNKLLCPLLLLIVELQLHRVPQNFVIYCSSHKK